jgi:hypothetical protein
MTDDTFIAWFELRSAYGVDHADNREPICEVALTLNLPVQTPDGIVLTGSQVCTIRPADKLTDDMPVRIIPGTRIVETSSMLAAQALYSRAEYRQLVDEPTAAAIKEAKSETAAHVDAMRKRAEAVARGSEHPADLNDPNPAPQPLTGAVSFALTADERLAIDKGIEAGEIDDDATFAKWLASTPIPEVVKAVGADAILAKRVLAAEDARGDARKGLVEQLHKIVNPTEAFA